MKTRISMLVMVDEEHVDDVIGEIIEFVKNKTKTYNFAYSSNSIVLTFDEYEIRVFVSRLANPAKVLISFEKSLIKLSSSDIIVLSKQSNELLRKIAKFIKQNVYMEVSIRIDLKLKIASYNEVANLLRSLGVEVRGVEYEINLGIPVFVIVGSMGERIDVTVVLQPMDDSECLVRIITASNAVADVDRLVNLVGTTKLIRDALEYLAGYHSL